MRRSALLLLWIVAYVVYYALASVALQESPLAGVAAEIARSPSVLLQPGLEGNTASQLAAMCDSGAIVAGVVWLLGRRTPGARVGIRHSAILIGLTLALLGICVLVAVASWVVATTFVARAVTVIVAALIAGWIGRRFWIVASSGTLSLVGSAGRQRLGRVVLGCVGVMFALVLCFTLAATGMEIARGVLALLVLIAPIVLLLGYLVFEVGAKYVQEVG